MTSPMVPMAGPRSGLKMVALKLLAATAVGLSLSACKPDEESHGQVAGWSIIDPVQRHPIMVSQKPANLSLRVARGSHGLATGQKAQLVQFLDKYRGSNARNSRLVVSVPSGSVNEVAAMTAVADMRVLFAEGGFTDGLVTVEPYHSDGDPQPPIRISYLRYVAEGPECGRWPDALGTNTSRNLNYHNFGCAQQKNLAAMIANPADLVESRTLTPGDATRRSTQMDKYQKGEPSGASRSADEQAASSH